ncbi:hypothetical protein MSG28_014460 [Choristoneura fumiferana]|uniref:Uncharacterized protein n=1 Tax=Choristoneura fumiferana TaxID=7141 RepID=A0ACC0JRI8_CHOFU|nr:hypothetical protein MSG28_014460 [Choristoneura fumiferana]
MAPPIQSHITVIGERKTKALYSDPKQSGTRGDSAEGDDEGDYRRPQPVPKADRTSYRPLHGDRSYEAEVVGPCARSARIATTILVANPAVKQQCLHCCVSGWREIPPELRRLRKRFDRLRLKKINRNSETMKTGNV